ncbi:MAG: DPP IV N-terminal domain-containing protein, partial [Anaerolineales bacterium]|nr:DPP IV N-terminal domain-containing protein [Anaerolineales bacterium]
SDTGAREVSLLNNLLYAEWVPNQPFTFTYSTAEAREAAPGWQAYNDLWMMRIDDEEAVPINVENIVESSSGGIYGWWGTNYQWAPDGSGLAWSRADSVGLLDFESGEFTSLLSFPVYTTFQDWVWQPAVSWSPDNLLLATTIHGPTFGSEQPENSPIFDVAVVTANTSTDTFSANIVERAGIWSSPKYSPFIDSDAEFPQAFLAYLQARSPLNSVNDEYDLVVADRDGSNARVIFPEPGRSGLQAQEIAWSPSGTQIAFIYDGNLWIIDAKSGRAQQITVDGGASSPQWAS